MSEAGTRTVYLARHCEASADESRLTERGRRQADLLGQRLRDVPFHSVFHGPLPRAAQTAALIGAHLPGVAPAVAEAAGDFVPYVPNPAELPADCAESLLGFLDGSSAAERARGELLARAALAEFGGVAAGAADRHDLVVTHAFTIGWLVRAAFDAPRWRWLGLNAAHGALTVIRYAPGARPPCSVSTTSRTCRNPCAGRASRPTCARSSLDLFRRTELVSS